MVDRISNLPDDLLIHILSFLPIEDVFTTSFVSKRWRPLWLSVTDLHFVEHGFPRHWNTRVLRYSTLIKLVDASILRRGIHQPIKMFRLDCPPCPVFKVKQWLNTAADRKVENLQFNCSVHVQNLPCTIFSITTLVVLKLHYTAFKYFSSVELPSLKTLSLDYVSFSKSRHFIDLLNGCRFLENLEVELAPFDFVDDPSSETKFTTLSKLVRADVVNARRHFDIPVRTFFYAETLRIDQFCDVDIPIFPNLNHLDLILGHLKWESVLNMLNHCPQLQTFRLENLYLATYMVWPNTYVVPECFSSQLRQCYLTEFNGTECEMTFAKFVMQNSTLLHTMTISCHPDLYHEKILEMRKELDSCPRSSASCELLFKDFYELVSI